MREGTLSTGASKADKKWAAGNAAQSGYECVDNAGLTSRSTISKQGGVSRALFTNCQEKGGFPRPSPDDAFTPSEEG